MACKASALTRTGNWPDVNITNRNNVVKLVYIIQQERTRIAPVRCDKDVPIRNLIGHDKNDINDLYLKMTCRKFLGLSVSKLA